MEIKEKGCVYFFRHIGLRPIKIGYSTNNNPINRFNQFKTYAPYGSEIIGFIQTYDSKEIETKLHIKYSQKRLSGEWFEITEDDVIKEIDFYLNIEDIRDRNEFQIAWANKLNKTKEDTKEYFKINEAKEKFIKMFENDKILNKTKISLELGVSRQTIYMWLKELKK